MTQTSRGDRGSDWVVVLRCLGMLHCLLRGPASGEALMQAALQAAGMDAYPRDEAVRKETFKRDRQRLREKLGVSFHFDAGEGLYYLEDPGPFGALELPQDALAALSYLESAFTGFLGEQAQVRALVNALMLRLSSEDQQQLVRLQRRFELDLGQGLDETPISKAVWHKVRRAVQEQRKLGFNYRSRENIDESPRYHQVAPQRIVYRNGHWYLDAFDLLRRTEMTEQRDLGHRNFRLSRMIEDDKLEVLPGKLPENVRRRPLYRVAYRLLPPLSYGPISRHFEEMQVTKKPDGTLEVEGLCDSVWGAARILLGYGEACIVTGGDEVLELIKKRLRLMVQNYQI